MKNVKALSRFNLGLIISMALTLVALEWKSYSVITDYPFQGEEIVEIEDDWMPIVFKVEKPKPKEKQTPKTPSTEIKVVENKVETVEEPVVKKEPVVDINPDALWKEEVVVEEDIPIDIPDVFPEYPNGEQAMLEFVYDNITYVEKCKDIQAEGTVWVQFVVGKDGKVRDIEILRGIPHCKELEKEVIRMLKKMPTWTPGKQKGHPVSCNFRLPVKFTLRN